MLRTRKTRRYNEETNDEEGDCERKYDLKEQIKSERFDSSQFKEKHLQELPGDAITLRLIQQNGFEKPILVTQPDGLDLRVPPKNFLVRDVRNHVGQHRIIDVMDVKTQKNIEMSMKDWCKYYESKNRDRLLNVISLEFSHTRLDELVDSPMIVKLLDWVDLVWPKFLKESQVESTNSIDKMKYPKVQKYCLMSVKGSYTDFHIDFGGTSVWYHILRGKKIFWMVPPTDLNLQTFEDWTLSGMQQDVFFGDTVEECFRVELSAGNTFFIPSGWIHAVYTLEDSIVFGGNFLHSFGIENQLKVSKIEDATKVPIKFRYPFYTEILWYVVQHYVHCVANKDHLHRPPIETQAQIKAITLSQSSEIKSVKTSSDSAKQDEGETTESEHEESDTTSAKNIKKGVKKSAKLAAKRKRGKPLRSKQQSQSKKAKKAQSSDSSATEEDESTEIDSSNEEYAKPPKITLNTCRMTKNSLLRLQYEVEDQEPIQSRPGRVKSDLGKISTSSTIEDKSPSKKQSSSDPNSTQRQSSKPQRQASTGNTGCNTRTNSNDSNTTSLNLAEMVLSSHESKSNGWCSNVTKTSGSGSGNTIWSSNVSREPERIHLTRFELNGLKALVKHLSKLSGAKKNLPTLIRNSRALLDDCRKMIVDHENDDPTLAVTGRPITLDLQKSSRTTDMNELIGQFFKSTDCEKTDRRDSSFSPNKSKNNTTETTSSTPIDLEKRSAVGGTSSLLTNTGNHTSEYNRQDKDSNTSKSPHKETKCLSPTKKLFGVSVSTAGHTSSSPPPRPRSPPTRPLSNNQYTSKTKNDNNLLLPGSFADLIAATSTEKKAFDYTGSDIATSLFGPSSSKPTTNRHSTPISGNKSARDMKNLSSSVTKTSATTVDLSSLPPGQAATCQTSSTFLKSTAIQHQQPIQSASSNTRQVNSPEPPKSSPPKRFINPQSFRPAQSKEKLIFASAPYVNPVNVSGELRASGPYPWQTPQTPQPHNQPTIMPAHQSQIYSPSVIKAPAQATQQEDTQVPSPALSTALNRDTQPTARNPSTNFQVAELARSVDSSQKPMAFTPEQYHEQVHNSASATGSTKPPIAPLSSTIKVDDSSTKNTNCGVQTVTKIPLQAGTSASKILIVEPVQTGSNKSATAETIDKKPANKPRGPPKKSKEARQLMESSSCDQALPPVATTTIISPSVPVVSCSNTTTPTGSAQVPHSSPARLDNGNQSSSNTSHKPPKAKRSKKKDEPGPSTTMACNIPSVTISAASSLNSNPTASGPQHRAPHPSVICGLVAPQSSSATASGPKLSQPSYLISRPLLFNTMPSFSHAQFQAMQQQSTTRMPLYSIPITSPLNLPFQQNARIVWATHPRIPNPNDSTPAPPIASMNPSKSTTQPPPPQDINLFAPLIQRMPMTHFVARSAAPRPSGGQLLFARLPTGANHVQGQPRYLITQPGFLQQHLPKS